MVLALAGTAGAQESQPRSFDDEIASGPARKQPGFRWRPEQETPALQLEHAQNLAAEGRRRKAARQYRALVHTWHDTPEASLAQRAYAENLEERGKYIGAFNEFQYLMDYYSGLSDYDEILDHQFRIANEVMNARHGRLLFGGFEAPERALPLFRKLAENGPTWERVPEVHFLIGWILEEDKQYDEAIEAYDELRQRWPGNELASSAAYGGTRCLVKLADTNRRDETSCRRALSALAGFVTDYPDSPNSTAATAERDRLSLRLSTLYYDRASYYDVIAKRPESALIAYADFLRQFPYADQAEKVSLRMRELEAIQQATPDGSAM